MLDKHAITATSLEKYYGINGKKLQRHYKNHLSGFTTWDQGSHAEQHLLYPENIGPYLSLDETALSNGELYTILTNKATKGKKGSIVAMVKGTKAEEIMDQVQKLGHLIFLPKILNDPQNESDPIFPHTVQKMERGYK